MEYKQHDEEIEIPKGAGVAGLIEAIKGVLRLPRVQNIGINVQGKITYSFFLPKGSEPTVLMVDFERVMPYAIARNGEIVELEYPSGSAIAACADLFERSARDHMCPVAFLGGDGSAFWAWYADSLNREKVERSEQLFGLPFLVDRKLEDTALLLCTGFKRGGTIDDTVKSYKISIPKALAPAALPKVTP